MRPLTLLARLPASLLLLVAAQVGLSLGQADAQRLPIAIRKMSPDAGEKLLHEYYAFGPDEEVAQVGSKAQPATFAKAVLDVQEEELLAANSSASISFRAPFAPHFDSHLASRDQSGVGGWHLFQRAKDVVTRLEKRQFACPTGTSDCSAIGFPNSCCQAGTDCVQITDTGLGPVGCCPDGISCTGSIACSGSQQGCPSDIGGGCCIEGFVCASIGCVQSATATETVVTRTSTLTSTANNGSPTTVIVTITVTPSASTTTSTTTRTSSTSTSTSEPSTTATSTSTSTSSTETGPGAPVRPTSMSTLTTPPGYCPTGFYACSAIYGGGCCQTGRDCHVTSCPTTVSTTIISGDQTIVVPATAVPTTTSDATCAGGWSLCPASAGPTAGCCPSGYNCGTASCFLATGSATASLAKELTANSGVRGVSDGLVMSLVMIPTALGFAFGFALV